MAARLGGLFDRFRTGRADPEDARRVKAWVREILALADDATVSVNEIACTDPTCPGLETVILVIPAGGGTRAFKSAGSLVVQTRPAIEKALAPSP
jgi:hypothetical protein